MDELNPPVLVPEQPRPPEELVSESIPESTPPTNHPRRLKLFILGGAIVFLAVLIGGIVYLSGAKKSAPKQIACTQEAKQCPDGSYVSRTGPNCAFAPCPTSTPDPTANWKIYTNTKYGFQIKYPQDAKTIIPDNWNTIDTKPSEVIIKFNFDSECLRKFEERGEDGVTECWGDDVDIFVRTDTNKQLKDTVEVEAKRLGGDICTVRNRTIGAINAFELTTCLVARSSFYYLEKQGNIFKIGVSDNTDKLTNQILSTFKFLDQNQTGVLEGKVTIGPLCPVEPCRVSINPYLGKEVILKSQAGNTVNIKLNSEGSFSGQVNPGTYSLDLNECQYLGCKATLPKTVTIEAGKTAEVNIDIDTGIR